MRRILTSLLVATVWIAAGSMAEATPIIQAGNLIRVGDLPGNTGGGEFQLNVVDTSNNVLWSFISFCLQRTQYIDYSNVFTVGGVNTYAKTDSPSNGGDANGLDPISDQTAYLYTMFSNGTLQGYNYFGSASSHAASADTLQYAFWMFEDELQMDPNNYYVQLANNAVTSGAWRGIGNVRVLNMTYANGVEARISSVSVRRPICKTRRFPNPRRWSFSARASSRWWRAGVALERSRTSRYSISRNVIRSLEPGGSYGPPGFFLWRPDRRLQRRGSGQQAFSEGRRGNAAELRGDAMTVTREPVVAAVHE